MLVRIPRALLAMTIVMTLTMTSPSFLVADDRIGKSAENLDVQQVNVYAVPGRFGGWPANHGIWSWGNEILVGFSAGYFKDQGLLRHAIDHDRAEEHLLARSLDGGLSWTLENPAERGALIPVGPVLHGKTPAGLRERDWQDCEGNVNFAHPDFAMTLRMTDANHGPSRFYYSYDRGKTWQGPFRLSITSPSGDPIGIAARTDYIVNGEHDCLVFLTAAKTDGREGRPFCARSTDGAKTWKFIAWIGDEPSGYAIMPSSIRLGPAQLLTTIRCREGDKSWIDAYRSLDDGQTWKQDSTPVADTGEGNPPSLLRLGDGRVGVIYGFRAAPFEIRARISRDGGRNWDPERTLRSNGGGRDLGYPVSILRPDRKVVTIYYFHNQPVGDRYIAATIWDPDVTAK